VGRATRRRTSFALQVASLTLGVSLDAVRPSTWRPTVRREFRRSLRQAVSGGLSTTFTAAFIVGLGLVYQALFWLGQTAETSLVATLVVTVLVRGLAPVLVGFILLGRSGVVVLSEFRDLRSGHRIDAIEAQGLDPVSLFLVPKACALAAGGFALGFMFVLVTLVTGFIAASLLRVATLSFWSFLDLVLQGMPIGVLAAFPVKMVAIGLLVAVTQGLTALASRPHEDDSQLMPRGFVRGVLAVLLVEIVLSLFGETILSSFA
jgi:phospholipid/cholesterol/gamma-HCH transport system permease protein